MPAGGTGGNSNRVASVVTPAAVTLENDTVTGYRFMNWPQFMSGGVTVCAPPAGVFHTTWTAAVSVLVPPRPSLTSSVIEWSPTGSSTSTTDVVPSTVVPSLHTYVSESPSGSKLGPASSVRCT